MVCIHSKIVRTVKYTVCTTQCVLHTQVIYTRYIGLKGELKGFLLEKKLRKTKLPPVYTKLVNLKVDYIIHKHTSSYIDLLTRNSFHQMR